MGKIADKFSRIRQGVRKDTNLLQARLGVVRGAKALPSATGRYLIQKIPVVQWLPNYSLAWIVNDFIAGLSVALVIIPQALSYAALAGVPVQFGLVAGWLPSVIYFFQGTSKGPTSMIGLLTGHVIMLLSRATTQAGAGGATPAGASPSPGRVSSGIISATGVLARETATAFAAIPTSSGFPALNSSTPVPTMGKLPSTFPRLPPALIATGIAFSVGMLALLMGLLNLGWMLDFVSLPVLTGFITAAALIVIQGQISTLLGETGVSNKFLPQGREIFTQIRTAKPLTFAMGISSLVLLIVLQVVGKKWGKKYKAVHILSTSRNAIVIILFTAISFAINKDLPTPLFAVTGKVPSEIIHTPSIPPLRLIRAISFLSFPLFLALTLEHITIAKSFGVKNGYTIDASQELVFLGVSNIANSLLGGMAVSGSISSSAVNSSSGVKSPLGGVITAGIVVLGIHFLNGTLFWIPQATLSAVVISTVLSIHPPIIVMRKYWRTSFIDFLAASLTMQVTLVFSLSAGAGIVSGLVFMVLYTLIRIVFTRAEMVTRAELENQVGKDFSSPVGGGTRIPPGVQVMALDQALIFMNAYRVKGCILDAVKTYHTGAPSSPSSVERNWNEREVKRTAFLRKSARLTIPVKLIPRLRILVLDFTRVGFVDATGMRMLEELKAELQIWGGEEVEIRFVGLTIRVRRRFERAAWRLCTWVEKVKGIADGDVCFESVRQAVEVGAWDRDSGLDFGFGNVLMSEEGSVFELGGEEEKGKRVMITQVSVKDGKAYKGS